MNTRAAVVFLAILLAQSGLAQEPPKSDLLSVRLEGGQLENNFAATIGRLVDERLIPLKPVRFGNQHRKVEAVLIERLGWPSGVTGAAMDSFLCRINPHSCRLSSTGKANWSAGPQPNSRDPQETDECSAKMPKDWLCVPMIEVTSYLAVQRRALPKDGSVATLLKENKGCPMEEERCKNMVQFLNPGKPQGSLLVPVRALRVPVQAADSETAEKIRSAVQNVRSERDDRRSTTSIYNHEIFVTTPAQGVRLQQAGPPATPPITAPPTAPRDYTAPLKAMAYPMAGAFQKQLQGYPVQTVAVMDAEADTKHCSLDLGNPTDPARRFKNAIIKTEHFSGKDYSTEVDTDKECKGVVLAAYRNNDRLDHSTHIAGVIASQANPIGMLGVNSRARIWAFNVKSEILTEADVENFTLTMISPDLFPPPNVVNLSIDLIVEDQKTTMFERVVIGKDQAKGDGLANVSLFVIAAGNARYEENVSALKIDRKMDCNLRPACWSHRSYSSNHGVISVVALNAIGSGILADRHGRPLSHSGIAFDVAAVGEAVSAFYGNVFGPMAGTSVAAPYVSGLATLLYSKVLVVTNRRLAPHWIRDRIRASGDLTPAIASLARFGRINFERALAFENDLIERCTDDAADCSGAPARLAGKLNNREAEIAIEDGDTDDLVSGRVHFEPSRSADRRVPIKQIRRISRMPDGKFWLFRELNGALVRMANVVFAPNQTLDLKVATDPIAKIPVERIKEFTQCSFKTECHTSFDQ